MNLTRTPEKCPAKMGRAEAKRVPKHRLYLAGYYIGCPACGWVAIVPKDEGQFVEEEVEGQERLTMLAPQTCARPSCGKTFTLDRDEFRFL